MTRKATSQEIRLALAGFAKLPPDDVDGYVVILASKTEVLATLSNASDLGTELMLLGRAIEHRSLDVSNMEGRL